MLLVVAAAAVVLGVLYYFLRPAPSVPEGKLKGCKTPEGAYDVVVVGAGPAGATTAYYLASGGKRVALLEKETFPRDKTCGNAWCQPALEILIEMGVLQDLEKEGKVLDIDTGGFVAPCGFNFIELKRHKEKLPLRTCSIERINCDERIAQFAERAGAALMEGFCVSEKPELSGGLWSVEADDGRKVRARVMVLADGSNSFIAKKLGMHSTNPTGFCTRQYFAAGTHDVKADGVLYYPEYIVPGYHAIYKNPNGEAGLGTYLFSDIGRNGIRERDLLNAHKHALENDPHITAAIPSDAIESDPIRIAPIRTKTIRSYGDHLLLVGDSAGMVDPLTGEGIQTAMPAGKIAAQTIHEMFAKGCFDSRAGKVYEHRWMKLFGNDAVASAYMARILAKFPFLLDAMAAVAERRGRTFMADFGAIMTGVWPKYMFLHPRLAVPLGIEVVRQAVVRGIFRVKYPDYAPTFTNSRATRG
eukprot:TRINITY_DN30536_c0_g1_i1.p1 TRINITY_DN30536_c0_g1~~TRINITY_DN30536_c0_g1_i1.p1  ORF type:complete len:498 (+),score=155.19 TRINITY_DN30536_c0_g1_i1:80-1495(+)